VGRKRQEITKTKGNKQGAQMGIKINIPLSSAVKNT